MANPPSTGGSAQGTPPTGNPTPPSTSPTGSPAPSSGGSGTSGGGAPPPAPRCPLARLWSWSWLSKGTALVAILAYIFNGFFGSGWLPGISSLQHAGYWPLRYEIAAPKDLRLNAIGNLSVTGYYIDRGSEPSDSLVCATDASPQVHGLSLAANSKCAPFATVFNDTSNFSHAGTRIPLHFTVRVRRRYALSFFGAATQTATVMLLDQAQPLIKALDAPQSGIDISVLVGGSVHLRADFPSGKVPSHIQCQWYEEGASSSPFTPSTSCSKVAFLAPKTALQVQSKAITIVLTVTDMNNHLVGKTFATIHLRLPPANFSVMVVDTSARMKGVEFDAVT